MNKYAVLLNEFRIIPRALIISYYILFANAFWWVTEWFMNFDWATVTNQAVALAIAGFPVGILGVMTGVLAHLTNNYFRTGNGNGE